MSLGYGNTGVYGSLLYKGQSIQVQVTDFLIEQYRKSYINKSDSVVPTYYPSTTNTVVTMEIVDSVVQPMLLIEQYQKGYING